MAPPPMRTAPRWLFSSIALVLAAATGCARPDPKVPGVSPPSGVEKTFVAAIHAEMNDPQDPEPYLDAVDAAVDNAGDPTAIAVLVASLDVLVDGGGRGPQPIAHRSREAFQEIAVRLREAWGALDGKSAQNAPLIKGLIARSLYGMALFTGETGGAKVWFGRRGCVSEAMVVGPLDTSPLVALTGPAKTPATGPMPSQFASPGTFNPALSAVVPADGCSLGVRGASDKPGLREVVLHIDNPSDQRLSFLMSTGATTVLEVGGVKVAERKYDAGWSSLLVMGHAAVSKGVVRVVVRVADKQDAGDIELVVLDGEGNAMPVRAPAAGEEATVKPTEPVEIALGSVAQSPSDASLTVGAAALLAVGDARRAEHLIERSLLETREGRDAALHLVWMRALERASDMADWKRIELTRASVDEIKKTKPDAWEAKVVAAELLQRRKGPDGTFEALVELGVTKPDADLSKLDVMELQLALNLAGQANLLDLAERIYGEIAQRAPGSPLVAGLDASMHPRAGRDWQKLACDGGLSKASTSCADAKAGLGDRKGALEELVRLRELTSSPRAYLFMEMDYRQKMGDDKAALAIYEKMLPWERSTSSILAILARMGKKEEAKAYAMRELVKDPSRPFTMQSVGLAFNEPSEDAKKFEEEGRAIVEADRKSPKLPGAATAVLKHVEHYGMDADGFMRVVLYDLKRVSGTTDVAQSFYLEQPMIDGRGYPNMLRRRVHKVDGRVLEAAMGDMSQLEKGDYVEHYLEGYYLPNELGEYTVDTPDLLPERTSVADAEIVLRLPESFKATFWTHAMLGKPVEEVKGGYRFMRYKLTNLAPRKIEDGLPWLERGVRISFGTQTWEKVGRAVGENMLGLNDSDPFIARFAKEAAKPDATGAPPTAQLDEAALVGRVVDHVGKTIKIASGGYELGDSSSFSAGGGHAQPIRWMVDDAMGSRTWILYSVLRELGVKVDLAVAETEPFSAAPNFPPHPGRFRKPLVIARLASGDVWIDADVQGPPLPPGRVSPELKGRSAILSGGQIIPVPVRQDETVDEAKVDLALDAQGTAKGTISLSLRGGQAQSLADAFNYVVGEDRRNMLRSVVQSWVPWASVDDVKLSSKEGSWEVSIVAAVTIPGLGSIEGKEGKTWVLPGIEPARQGTLAQIYASKAERESALNIDWPIQYKLTRRIKLPAGAKIEKLASGLEQKGDVLGAQRSIRVDGDTIVEDFVMNLPTGTVEAEGYRKFLDDVQAVDSGFLAGTRVRVKP
jgi:tetratricopeptide (TPR) repeat protein